MKWHLDAGGSGLDGCGRKNVVRFGSARFARVAAHMGREFPPDLHQLLHGAEADLHDKAAGVSHIALGVYVALSNTQHPPKLTDRPSDLTAVMWSLWGTYTPSPIFRFC